MKKNIVKRSFTERAGITVSVVSFSLFVVNVLYVKFIPSSDQSSLSLDRAPEFLLLFATAVSFTVASLAAERRTLKK